MKYIDQYIKKLCPDVVVQKSLTTDTVYYKMENKFIIRLSDHVGHLSGKDYSLSVIKAFNSDKFVVMVSPSQIPLIKDRNGVKEMISVLYESNKLLTIAEVNKKKIEEYKLESITEWSEFWSVACDTLPHARYLSKETKSIICHYFSNEDIRGRRMMEIIKKIKPLTQPQTVEMLFKQ